MPRKQGDQHSSAGTEMSVVAVTGSVLICTLDCMPLCSNEGASLAISYTHIPCRETSSALVPTQPMDSHGRANVQHVIGATVQACACVCALTRVQILLSYCNPTIKFRKLSVCAFFKLFSSVGWPINLELQMGIDHWHIMQGLKGIHKCVTFSLVGWQTNQILIWFDLYFLKFIDHWHMQGSDKADFSLNLGCIIISVFATGYEFIL